MFASLFTFNSISTRYSVIMLAIISKLPAPILTWSLNDICSFYRVCTRCTRCTFIRIGAITSKHRAGVLSSSRGVTFTLLVSSSMPLRSSVQQCTGRILRPAPTSLVSRHRRQSGLRFIRCIITRHISYALDLCRPSYAKISSSRRIALN